MNCETGHDALQLVAYQGEVLCIECAVEYEMARQSAEEALAAGLGELPE